MFREIVNTHARKRTALPARPPAHHEGAVRKIFYLIFICISIKCGVSPSFGLGFGLLFHYECIITLILSYYYSTIILMLFYYYLCIFQLLFLIHMFNLFFLLFVLFLFLIVYLLHPFFNGLVCPISFLHSYLFSKCFHLFVVLVLLFYFLFLICVFLLLIIEFLFYLLQFYFSCLFCFCLS